MVLRCTVVFEKNGCYSVVARHKRKPSGWRGLQRSAGWSNKTLEMAWSLPLQQDIWQGWQLLAVIEGLLPNLEVREPFVPSCH